MQQYTHGKNVQIKETTHHTHWQVKGTQQILHDHLQETSKASTVYRSLFCLLNRKTHSTSKKFLSFIVRQTRGYKGGFWYKLPHPTRNKKDVEGLVHSRTMKERVSTIFGIRNSLFHFSISS
ncbi:hypothetical protein P3L10_019261 [Capsicum annuum]